MSYGQHDIQSQGLSEQELLGQEGTALPERELMSTIRAGGLGSTIDTFAMPINEAVAVNYDSVSSIAIADADQILILDQSEDIAGQDAAAPGAPVTPPARS
ncbi:MAG: hypothetical protein M3179_13890 [Actinomycetota bacterium]|nr:hypothetical protein [Actinomycetota bacterium]